MKLFKNILLIGNDWLAHVVLGRFFIQLFGWCGVPLAFVSHFGVDVMPHGHTEAKFWKIPCEIVKGVIATIIILILITPEKRILTGVGIVASLFPDILLKGAKLADKEKLWKNFSTPISIWVEKIVYSIIWSNYFFHWFGRKTKLTFRLKLNHLWKETVVHNCGLEGKGILPNWWNTVQLALSICILIVWLI